ncbi:hypothetical protein GCM10020367_71000 [Streptomyces sannanensis]|uniref:Transcriptional regulator n=1 Tax=Streptomyces sannanensis TaxID=285536 RepID=A0ABP6SNA3_9ACTN
MERRAVLTAALATGATITVGTQPATAAGPLPRDRDIAAARRAFTEGRYAQLHQALPRLLAAADHTTTQELAPAALARASQVLTLAAELATKLGHTRHAARYAARATEAARCSGHPLALALAVRAAATPLRRTGRTDLALHLLAEAHDHLTGHRGSASALDTAGMLALTTAYTAAQSGRARQALELAERAEETAARLNRLTGHQDRPGLTHAHCTLYRIGIHHHLGDPDTALAHARHLTDTALPSPERRARRATDTARALLAAGDPAGAFTQLLAAEAAAPQEVRRPSLRDLTAAVRAQRPGLGGLADFAERITPSRTPN